MPVISEYLDTYPETEVDGVFLDRVVNLLDEGLDAGIRIGQLPDSSMRALRVGSVRLVLCAAPTYLEKYGIPQTPSELTHHQTILSKAVNTGKEWHFEAHNNNYPVKISPRLTVNTNDAAIEAAKAGLGITRLLSYQIAPYLASGALKIVLENYEPSPYPIHVVHREGYHASTKVRAFIDLIAERLRSNIVLN